MFVFFVSNMQRLTVAFLSHRVTLPCSFNIIKTYYFKYVRNLLIYETDHSRNAGWTRCCKLAGYIKGGDGMDRDAVGSAIDTNVPCDTI